MQELAHFPRVRDVIDALGNRLRLTVEPRDAGAMIVLECPGERHGRRAVLDGYGGELLREYIMSARLALPNALPDEPFGGTFPSRLRLVREPAAALSIMQAELERPFLIPATFWDRLYAELGLVIAHAREIARTHVMVLQ